MKCLFQQTADSFVGLKLRAALFFSAASLGLLAIIPASQAQNPVLTILHNFGASQIINFSQVNNDGVSPIDSLIQGADGNFYGNTYAGGINGRGTAFSITPDGAFSTLHVFDPRKDAGGGPSSGLVQGQDGNFYGTENASSPGSIFQIKSDGTLVILHAFKGADGENPETGLVLGGDSNFYGLTRGGGNAQNGTVFKVTPTGVLTTLHSFSATDDNDSNADGSEPVALMRGSDGKFYGSTFSGGPNGLGTIFSITSDGTFTALHYNTSDDGLYDCITPMVQGSDGNFYGTTYAGGLGFGTIFKITPAGVPTLLHTFSTISASPVFEGYVNADGGYPDSAMIQASDGNFYGTTVYGGANGGGTIFQITPGGTFKVVYDFGQEYGFQLGDPSADHQGIIQGNDGNLYGIAVKGGANGTGIIFRLALGLPPVVAATPSVMLTANVPTVVAGSGDIGEFTLSLSAAQATDLIVSYTIKGSGTNGTDYVFLTGTKKIKAGKTSKPIKVIPEGNLGGAAKKTVKLTLAQSTGYTIGAAAVAKVKIYSSQP